MRRIQLFAYSLVLGLTACGGGGGDGGSSGTIAGSGGPTTTVGSSGPSGPSAPVDNFPPQTPLAYAGVSTAATVSATSAGAIASSAVGANTLTHRLALAMRSDAMAAASGSAMGGAPVNQSMACDSGSVSISGSLAANGTGTVAVTYHACMIGSDTLNGPASLAINGYDATSHLVTDGMLSFTRVDFTGPGMNLDLTGTLHTQADVPNQTLKLTQNLVTQDRGTGRMAKTENLLAVNVYDSVTIPTFYTQSVTGRVFDSAAGFVDVATSTPSFAAPWGPLYFATSVQLFPDWGIMDLTGSTAGHVRVTSMGMDLAKVEVDANADGVFENKARLRWTELSTAIGSDLADNDGDGMHNSWEVAYGLNPNDPSDAGIDNDGDGFSNLTEYLNGSDPITNGSVPPVMRHLWVTNNRDLAVDPITGNIEVFVGATGSGVMLDTVTAELGAPFSGATEPNGAGNQSVTDVSGTTWTLTPTAVPTTWMITSSTGASLTITSVAGTNPGSLIRYGAHGLAFRTAGAASPGYIYLVESAALVP